MFAMHDCVYHEGDIFFKFVVCHLVFSSVQPAFLSSSDTVQATKIVMNLDGKLLQTYKCEGIT